MLNVLSIITTKRVYEPDIKILNAFKTKVLSMRCGLFMMFAYALFFDVQKFLMFKYIAIKGHIYDLICFVMTLRIHVRPDVFIYILIDNFSV